MSGHDHHARDRPESSASDTKVEYVCPMHPQIVRAAPGSCPICGMALEPRTASLEEASNLELQEMTRRFWVSLALSVPVAVLGMAELPGPRGAGSSSRCRRRWSSGAAGPSSSGDGPPW